MSELTYQVWGSKPKVTVPTSEGNKVLGWSLVCTTNELTTLFIEKMEAEQNYQKVVVTKAIELSVEITDPKGEQ